MSNIDDKVKERILKIYKLAEQGVGGEQYNAKNILDKLLAKHGINLSEILDDTQDEWFEVSIKSRFERRLITQIISRARGGRETYGHHSKNKFKMKVSKIEFAEILTEYSIYRKALSSEFECIFSAFIHKQKIFPPINFDENSEDKPKGPQSPEDRARIRKIAFMMETMDKVTVHKAIEG